VGFGYSAVAGGSIDSLIAAVDTPIGRFLLVVQDHLEKICRAAGSTAMN
jgi:hypothetical protein